MREQEWHHDRPYRHSFRLCKRTLRKAPVEARKEAVPDQDDHGQKCERLPCRKAWPPYTVTSQHCFRMSPTCQQLECRWRKTGIELLAFTMRDVSSFEREEVSGFNQCNNNHNHVQITRRLDLEANGRQR